MIRDFGVNEHDVGSYAGVLSGCFCISQFVSSFGWGWFSDFYSKQKILLFGITCGMTAMLILGFSKSYYQAISARIIGGLFNGNVGVMRSWIADITYEKNRTFAFSTCALGWGFGTVIASISGGLLVDLPFWIFDSKYTPEKYSFPY